ncbi:hypothetical protein RB213_004644, partial [Colletotrichum asianum]
MFLDTAPTPFFPLKKTSVLPQAWGQVDGHKEASFASAFWAGKMTLNRFEDRSMKVTTQSTHQGDTSLIEKYSENMTMTAGTK